MTLQEAREDYARWDRLAMKFPDNRAIQLARKQSYEQWLVAVRYWRLSDGRS